MVDTQTFSRSEIINLIIRLAVLTGVTFFSVRWMVSQLDPTNKQKKKAKKKVSYVLEMVRWFYIIYSST
jgi:flagellar basal body-associated protein FliL